MLSPESMWTAGEELTKSLAPSGNRTPVCETESP